MKKKNETEEEQQFKGLNPLLLILYVAGKLKFWKHILKRDTSMWNMKGIRVNLQREF
jgi:hypothetical protein